MAKKLLLIDGHSILNRSFYGLPDLTNPEGLHTNAVLGFLNILFKLIENEKPDFLTVAFDVHAPTFRHEIYKEYKGTRKPMPEELRQQVPLMKEVLDSMNITRYEEAGLEADDILGTLAKRAENEGMVVTLVSGDRDLLQIASEKIMIDIPKTKAGKTEYEHYYTEDVIAAYGVNPAQFIELKALMGDTADNIPGVPKVGEKTAKDLMMTYGSIEGIYSHIDEITKKAIKESLIANRDLCDLSKVLATIKTDCALSIDIDKDAKIPEDMFNASSYEQFKRLGFKSLLKKFDDNVSVSSVSYSCNVITDLLEAENVFERAFLALTHDDSCIGAAVIEDSSKEADFIGVSIAFSQDETFFIKKEGMITCAYLGNKLSEISKKGMLSMFDIKSAYHIFRPNSIDSGIFDILIGAYLINPLKNDYAPEDIAGEYLGLTLQSKKERFEKTKFIEAEEDKLNSYASDMAHVSYMAYKPVKDKLVEEDMLTLMNTIEMPLTYVLYDMEKTGIIVKRDELKEYGDKLGGRILELEKSIHEAAGSDFNINSPKQLSVVLFEDLKLPGGKKTKTGYSTSADVLEKLAPENKIVADILEYRALSKLKSTYADGLDTYIEEDGRIHTNYNQTITATGRISSTEPNLQNIPMRTELGRMIRKVFVPKDDYLFTDADYSQIELRILAHMSKDQGLIDAYHEGRDIHRITASKVFHTPFEEVTDIQRRNAKAVNFGIVYGISSFGLGQDLDIPRSEAKAYMEQYIATYPGVKTYQDEAVESAKEKGYAITLFGRRRPMPELKAGNFMQRQFGERVAMNAPIQGTAADIMKIAMINVWKELEEGGYKSKLILQIHDELVIETAPDEKAKVEELLERNMEEAAKLSVKLEADCHSGSDWFEAKG